ncbi:MAG: hypothetical protein P8P44_00515 [Alphaproteobacteria bacterium]|nr:hypothetical protein [Alphaproteobacteria bacterium]
MRILARMFEQNGTLFIGAGIAVLVLMLLVILSRRMRRKNTAVASDNAAGMVNAPLPNDMEPDDIELDMADDAGAQGETLVFEADGVPEQTETPLGDPLDNNGAHQFDMDDDVMDDIDDLTIPKVGQAPPPRKSKFFSASWLHRDKAEEPAIIADSFEAPDARTMKNAGECARLAEIERNMLALRELYEAGLIAPEVYVLKAREFAAQAA